MLKPSPQPEVMKRFKHASSLMGNSLIELLNNHRLIKIKQINIKNGSIQNPKEANLLLMVVFRP